MRLEYAYITPLEVIPMKTRAEIYGNEAAALLRIVTMYPGLNMQQLLCFHPGKEEIIKTLLSHLQKQGRIFQTDTGGYFPSGWAAKSDNSLIRAAWVLLDFIGQVEYHAPGDFPVKLIFFANGELYEIVYAASGQEALINHALRDDSSGGRRIILVDNPEDIRRIDCPGISGFCTVDAAGQVHYFKKTGGTISHRIGSILDDISRLSNALYAMDTTDIQRYPDNYEVLSTDAALRAEKIACRLRHLIYSSTTIRKGDYLTSAGIVHGIEVVYEDGVLEVTLPGLLPKRPCPTSAIVWCALRRFMTSAFPPGVSVTTTIWKKSSFWMSSPPSSWLTIPACSAMPTTPLRWAKRTVPESVSWKKSGFPPGLLSMKTP